MYIDFNKYNYDLVPEERIEAYKERDKNNYKSLLKDWLEENLEHIIERKWEIQEIHYLKDISDFIKLLREAEQLYEFGFYTGCIALTGVATEDFCRFLSIQLGKPRYITLTQNNRLNKLRDDGFITSSTYNLMDNIRLIRNDCLHYHQNFKQKETDELKSDALEALNKLKEVLKTLIGENEENYESDFQSIIEGIASGEDIMSDKEIGIKVKNAVSRLLKFPIAFDPIQKTQFKTSFFRIIEIDQDFEEVTLEDVANELRVIVELPEEKQDHFDEMELKDNDYIQATLVSHIDKNGMTAEWHLLDIDKISKEKP